MFLPSLKRLPHGMALSWALAISAAPAPAQEAEAQFKRSCMSCHTIGAGKKVGPDLKDLGKRRPHEWSARFITNPAGLLDGGDPIAATLLREYNGVRMPELGITPPQAEALLKYIDECTAKGVVVGKAREIRIPNVQDIRIGRELFTGERRLKNGGPSCLSCHSAQGIGGFGGGRLGPDLTGATAKFGPGLAGALETPAFPTMQGVFAKSPLVVDDKNGIDEPFWIAAYLQSLNAQPPAKRDAAYPVVGILGLAAGMLLGGRMGRKRLRGVRKNLKAQR
ncbi:MAG: cytochrome c [Acidobacteria bacterium]|nr:cytochrome c [Acidobacteriota bacterium]